MVAHATDADIIHAAMLMHKPTRTTESPNTTAHDAWPPYVFNTACATPTDAGSNSSTMADSPTNAAVSNRPSPAVAPNAEHQVGGLRLHRRDGTA